MNFIHYFCFTEENTLIKGQNFQPFKSLRKLLRDDSVISVKLYSTSFLRFFLIIYKKYFTYFKKYIDSINVWKKIALMTFELHDNMHY